MTVNLPRECVAIDVGNSRVKFGRFVLPAGAAPRSLPMPMAVLEPEMLESWILEVPRGSLWIGGSVDRSAGKRVHRVLGYCGVTVRWVKYGDLPLTLRVTQPERVGIDRLLAAHAVNQLRPPGKPAVVVSAGTAITVDWIAGDGAFFGGAILPGLAMSAAALHERTSALPLVDVADVSPAPPALGTSTEPAIRAGVYWGAIGAIREIVAQQARSQGVDPAAVPLYVTGGAAPALAPHLPQAEHHPYLPLRALALLAATT